MAISYIMVIMILTYCYRIKPSSEQEATMLYTLYITKLLKLWSESTENFVR